MGTKRRIRKIKNVERRATEPVRWPPKTGEWAAVGRCGLVATSLRKVLKMDKRDFKKTREELQDYLAFRRRGTKVAPKKGKGSFKRKEKHKEDLRD